MAESKLATFKCDPEVWEAFKTKAAESKTNASAVLKGFIQAYLDGRIDLPADRSIGAIQGIDERIEASLDVLRAELRTEIQELSDRLGKLKAA